MIRIEDSQPTQGAIERLNRIQEFSTQPIDPRVAMFAKFVATRLNERIVPLGFMFAASMALYDVEQGVDSSTGEPLNTRLEHNPQHVYTLLSLSIPDLADASFPKPFADEVRLEYQRYLDTSGKETDELVTRPVTMIEQAQALIIDSALGRVKALDWKGLGVNGERLADVERFFGAVYGLILRNSGMNFPLNILMTDQLEEKAVIGQADPERKKHLGEKFWLVLMKRPVSIEEATLIRDWLYVKAPEPIAAKLGLNPSEVAKQFVDNDASYSKAVKRIIYFTQANK